MIAHHVAGIIIQALGRSQGTDGSWCASCGLRAPRLFVPFSGPQSVERRVELPREPRAPRFAGDFRHAVVALARAREAARASRLAAYAARRAASDAATEISSESSSRVRTSAEAYENEAIMHELLVDPEWRLPANENAFSANAAPVS